MRHLIKKQIIELNLNRSLNHYRVQQQVSERYWREILPMLEKAFDAISNEDELIEIDHFELDLGVVSVDEIEKESWAKEIQQKISEKMAAITDPASSQYAIRKRDRRLGIFGEWLYYMDHGFLSWNSPKPEENWYRDVLEAIAVDIQSHQILQQRIKDHPFFLQRVVSQHADNFLHKLAEILTAKKQGDLPAAIDELLLLYGYLKNRKKISSSDTDRQFKNDRWQWILESAAGKRAQPQEETLAAGLSLAFVKEFSMSTKIPASLAEKIPHVLPSLPKDSEELKNDQQREKKKTQKGVQDMEDLAMSKNKEPAKYRTDEPEDLSGITVV